MSITAQPNTVAGVPTATASLSQQARTLAPWAVGIAAIGILVYAYSVSANLAIYWALGLSTGLVLQRGRLCFAGAFRDLYLMRNGSMMRAVIVGLAVLTPVFALIESKAVPNPAFGAVAQGAHVIPLGMNVIAGGLLFGIGMVVAGGCVSGTLYRIGEGYLASWASLLGILIGLTASAQTWNLWYTLTIENAPMGWLPTSLGYGGAVALTLAMLAVAYVAVLWWESRGATPGFHMPAPKAPPPPVTLGDRLQVIRKNVLVTGWTPLVAVAALSFLNVAAFLIGNPLGVTGELGAWAGRAAAVIGIQQPTLLGADALGGCMMLLGSGWITGSTMLDGGLVIGALLAALAAREFKLRAPKQKRRYVQSVGGGLLMGYGAGIGVGCTLGAFFSSIPSLGLSGWLFGLALLAGAGIGTQIIRRIA